MRNSLKFGSMAVLAAATMLMSGCSTNYYLVKEPVGGKTFYTNEVEEVKGGAVKFKDAKTKAIVTIQNSAIKEITEQEFNAGAYAPEPVKEVPAPVVTPAPAPAPVTAPAPAPAPAPAEATPEVPVTPAVPSTPPTPVETTTPAPEK